MVPGILHCYEARSLDFFASLVVGKGETLKSHRCEKTEPKHSERTGSFPHNKLSLSPFVILHSDLSVKLHRFRSVKAGG